ncbi:MAG TPA: NADH-quinone oxidoreductase subunit C [Planctomycetota bacterium]
MDAIDNVAAAFGDQVLGIAEHAGQRFLNVKRDRIVDILRHLRDKEGFDVLTDLTAVDYLNQGQPERFCVVYNLTALSDGRRTRVKAWVPESDPSIETADALWKAANWAEREVFDFFGIIFKNHPDLKRIQLPFDYEGHPLRKDYPLTGRGERMNFPRYVP